MIYRNFPRGLDLLKINIVALVFLPSAAGKQNFHTVNSCTNIKLKDIPIDVFQKCSKNNSAIHCLPDENNELGLSCFPVTWISEGKCPSYNSYQGNMDEKACSTDHNGKCPTALYKSPLSVRYTGCYIKELIPPPTTTQLMTTKTMTTKTPTTSTSSDPMSNDSIAAEKINKTCQNDVSKSEEGWKKALITILVLAVILIAVDCTIFKRILRDKVKQMLREGDSQQQNIDDETSNPMVEKIAKCNGSVHQK